jgi:hypothetical protein
MAYIGLLTVCISPSAMIGQDQQTGQGQKQPGILRSVVLITALIVVVRTTATASPA